MKVFFGVLFLFVYISSASAEEKKIYFGNEVEALIEEAINPPKRKRFEIVNKPEELTKNQIDNTLRGINKNVRNCWNRFKVPGLVNVNFTINSNGYVESVKVKDIFFDTPTGRCITEVLQKARFLKSSRSLKLFYVFVMGV